jgi:hypothetical protein
MSPRDTQLKHLVSALETAKLFVEKCPYCYVVAIKCLHEIQIINSVDCSLRRLRRHALRI